MTCRKEKARLRVQAWRDKQPKKERRYTKCGHCSKDITATHFNTRYCSEECRRVVGRALETNHPDYHERRRECSHNWARKNRDKVLTSSDKYRQANKPYYAAQRAKRRAAQLERTPPWSNQSDIEGMYKLAARLSELTGVLMEVDHIIPLQGELVSGLHVATNLQIIPRSTNRRKGNRYHV